MSSLEPVRARQEVRGISPRIRQLGRIRIGEQVATARGGTRPAKLDHFRLTSPYEELLRKLAGIYGGTVRPWTSPNGAEYEAHLETDVLDVAIPPDGMDLTQRYELWTAAGRQRSCDGYDCLLPDGSETACQCPDDPAERVQLAQQGQACGIKTRINVILPDSGHIGFWRLDTGSWYAAQEFLGTLEVLRMMNRGLARARLRLEQRRVKRIKDGKPITQVFIVPVIELPEMPRGVLAGTVAEGEGSLTAASTPRALSEGPRPEAAADHSGSPLEDDAAPPAPPKATAKQKQKLAILAGELGWDTEQRRAEAGVASFSDLSIEAASTLIEDWTARVQAQASSAQAPGTADAATPESGTDDPPTPTVGELPEGSAGSVDAHEREARAYMDVVFGDDITGRTSWAYGQLDALDVTSPKDLTEQQWLQIRDNARAEAAKQIPEHELDAIRDRVLGVEQNVEEQ